MKLVLILGLLVMLVVTQACEDCSKEPVHQVCGKNDYGFVANFDNLCAMERFNCRWGQSYVQHMIQGCWDHLKEEYDDQYEDWK